MYKKNGSNGFAMINAEEFQGLIRDKDSLHTQRATEKLVNVLRAYCKAKKLTEKFEELSNADLADLLKKFYTETHREERELYKTGSLVNLWAGVNRFLKD